MQLRASRIVDQPLARSRSPELAPLHHIEDRRAAIPFRSVNRLGSVDHDPDLQRHHLLPRQLLGRRCFGPMFDKIGREPVGFEDFRANGLLLPAT